MRPLSVSTALFDGYPIATALREIAAAGLGAVELAYIRGYVDFDETAFGEAPARELRSRLAGLGLTAIAVSAHMDVGAADAAPMLARRVRFAADVGAGILITNATTRDRRDPFLAALDEILPLAAERDVTIALENPGHGDNDLVPTGRSGAALIEAIGSPHLRLNYDFGNVFTYNREAVDVLDDFAAASRLVVHAHLKDVLADQNGWTFVPVGDGSVGYGAIAAHLAAAAPDLPVCLELPLRLTRPGRRDPVRSEPQLPLAAIRQAIARSAAFWRRVDTLG